MMRFMFKNDTKYDEVEIELEDANLFTERPIPDHKLNYVGSDMKVSLKAVDGSFKSNVYNMEVETECVHGRRPRKPVHQLPKQILHQL